MTAWSSSFCRSFMAQVAWGSNGLNLTCEPHGTLCCHGQTDPCSAVEQPLTARDISDVRNGQVLLWSNAPAPSCLPEERLPQPCPTIYVDQVPLALTGRYKTSADIQPESCIFWQLTFTVRSVVTDPDSIQSAQGFTTCLSLSHHPSCLFCLSVLTSSSSMLTSLKVTEGLQRSQAEQWVCAYTCCFLPASGHPSPVNPYERGVQPPPFLFPPYTRAAHVHWHHSRVQII